MANEGRRQSELAQAFPCIMDWDGFDELSEDWTPNSDNDKGRKQERVPEFLEWVKAQPERKVVVVGHGAFLKALVGKHMNNCEVRLF